ncbi:hypothetical protein HELRODRAFT_188264 [Helobdella robusta]|uniref:Secreted protein n=1 Tax=Helobdella robusta TaxID=6412 RepID=T1FPT5_HELRO|nr:hypothetical protein HELRODRAFT_188264 [Helobdella robusta]ESO06108.1 hypothetical protein HELRODRAFT_188264 [Helobdella robusta]
MRPYAFNCFKMMLLLLFFIFWSQQTVKTEPARRKVFQSCDQTVFIKYITKICSLVAKRSVEDEESWLGGNVVSPTMPVVTESVEPVKSRRVKRWWRHSRCAVWRAAPSAPSLNTVMHEDKKTPFCI